MRTCQPLPSAQGWPWYNATFLFRILDDRWWCLFSFLVAEFRDTSLWQYIVLRFFSLRNVVGFVNWMPSNSETNMWSSDFVYAQPQRTHSKQRHRVILHTCSQTDMLKKTSNGILWRNESQAGLQDCTEKRITSYKYSSNYWTSISQSCVLARLPTTQYYNRDNTMGAPLMWQWYNRHRLIQSSMTGYISFWTNWSMSNPAREQTVIQQVL